jgi:hypothetical protein
MPRALGVAILLAATALVVAGCSSTPTVTVTKTRTVRLPPQREPTVGNRDSALRGLAPLTGLVPDLGKPLQGWRIPSTGGEPAQLLVHWTRIPSEVDMGSHVSLWQLVRTRGVSSLWRRIWTHDVAASSVVVVRRGDVDGDARDEVVVMLETGSGGCGPRFVLTTHGRGVRSIYGATWTAGR